MRWKSLSVALVALLATLAGCKQRLFIASDDYEYYRAMLPTALSENNPHLPDAPVTGPVGTPTTVLDPDRPIRYLCLAEAVAIALQQGTVGNQNVFLTFTPGPNEVISALDQPVQFTGNGITNSDSIRVFRLDPATVGAGIESSLSKFDAEWITSMSWNTTDTPVATSTQTFQAGGTSAISQEQATFSSQLLKPLPTGGVAGITWNTNYTLTNLPARANPAYQPQLQFSFEQPLLQGYGVEINQLRPNHPGSILFPGTLQNTAPTQNGILISRIRFDQQRAEFERLVNIMLFNVETAYWNLYNSYWQLYSAEQGLRQSYVAWQITMAKFEAGSVAIADLEQARGQYEQFRASRVQALNGLIENERQLRAILGMPAEDCTRLVPCDTPTLAPYQPDWCSSLQEALQNRPELVMAREDVKANQLNVVLQKNSLLPDLRFTATYDINDLGSRLDTAPPTGALGNLSNNHFNDWALGLRYTVPIGYRLAHSNLRQARLQLARSYEVLRDQELKVGRLLAFWYRRITTNYELIKINRAQREAFAEQLKARFQEYLAGRQNVTLDRLLEAQRTWAAALAAEYVSIRDYNDSIVGWELAKGTIQQRNNVVIGEGPLPIPAQKRAADHEQERAKSLLVRERPVAVPVGPVDLDHAPPVLQPASPDQNMSVPDLWIKDPPLKGAQNLPSAAKLFGGVQQAKAEMPVNQNGVKTGAPVPIPVISTSDKVVPVKYQPAPAVSTSDRVVPANYQPAPAVSTTSSNPGRIASYQPAPAISTSAYNPTARTEAPSGSTFGMMRPFPDNGTGAVPTQEFLVPPPPAMSGPGKQP